MNVGFTNRKFNPGGFSSYGGTVYEVYGGRVKVRWETKRDAFGFNSWSYITSSEKRNSLSGPFGMPYDDEYYNASELKKIDFLSW